MRLTEKRLRIIADMATSMLCCDAEEIEVICGEKVTAQDIEAVQDWAFGEIRKRALRKEALDGI